MEKSGREVMYSSKCLNSNYMEFFCYEICDKLIWTSGKGCRNSKKISKQGIPKINMNMKSPSATLSLGCPPHKSTCDFLSENLVSQRFQTYSSINEGGLLMHINKDKSRHSILLPTTCGYRHCGKKRV